MKVELLSYTPDALNLLLRTKGTRLAHDDDPANWNDEKKAEHLAYMRDTIKSSWEFVDYVFRIEDVTRAFTHQLVRTRTGSYAQEAMRVIDASGFGYLTPPSVAGRTDSESMWHEVMGEIDDAYGFLIHLGVPRQDARGVLPTNVLTSIIGKFNLRTLNNMAELRLCTRTQGEYQNVFREMRRLVIEVHPWAADFIQVFCVNHGHCAFPRYGKAECPVYPAVIPNEEMALRRASVYEAWNTVRYEANPQAKDGKAM
jgi:flavin-dependent thymidylate synthase